MAQADLERRLNCLAQFHASQEQVSGVERFTPFCPFASHLQRLQPCLDVPDRIIESREFVLIIH